MKYSKKKRNAVCLIFFVLLGCRDVTYAPDTKQEKAELKEHKYTNRLINETSPYLLQHAHNPVDWYPWGEEAFEKAKRENIPIFLSIGYSACHWCHVMEEESFENEEIADIMNRNFVCIKVDREELPDIDRTYMTAAQLMTGSGGWPLSVFLDTKLRPFYAGTYFPPEDKWGRPGFKSVLLEIERVYKEEHDKISANSEYMAELISVNSSIKSAKGKIEYSLLEECVKELKSSFDNVHGGFGKAPKFPPSQSVSLLLRYYKKTHDEEALSIITRTLDRMASGGMYDQLGGGFHRYSVDEKWLVPHFEKMLYDNAQLSRVYYEAYQVTKQPFYMRIASEVLDYVLKEMTGEEGGFYSSQDADSEGEEGRYYVWAKPEIEKILGKNDAEVFCEYFGVSKKGNFEGENILHITGKKEKVSGSSDKQLRDLKQKLLTQRQKRIKPGTDDKILTSWNGLMISGFCKGYQVTGEKKYLEAAERSADFILTKLNSREGLMRTYRKGRAKVRGYLDDYAFLSNALVDLYESTFDIKWLNESEKLVKAMINKFYDNKNGAFFYTSDEHDNPISRGKGTYDSVIPSGNSIAALVLLRLGRFFDKKNYLSKAEDTLSVFAGLIKDNPTGLTGMLSSVDFYLDTPVEIVVSGNGDIDDIGNTLNIIYGFFMPNKVVAYIDVENRKNGSLRKRLPFLRNIESIDGKTTIYICENYSCQFPITNKNKLINTLSSI